MKLMYKEDGGFHYFNDAESPAGWVDGEPVRKALMDAKNPPIAKAEETVTIQSVEIHPQAEKPRLGRPPNKK